MSREGVANAIQATAAEDSDLNGAVLTGWVVIGEFSDGDGKRWLSRMAGDIRGEVPPTWTIKGWMTDSLDDLAAVFYLASDDEEDDE